MWNKIVRLSRPQLLLLEWFLSHPKEYGSVKVLSKETKLVGKALGGTLSSLARTKFRQLPLIEPWGRPPEGGGLRWKLNPKFGLAKEAREEVARLLASY